MSYNHEHVVNTPFVISDSAMKVVCNAPPIIEKCDVNNINGYDVTYMNKLNETLNVNGDLKFNSTERSSDDVTAKHNGHSLSEPSQNAIWHEQPVQADVADKKDAGQQSDDSGLESAATSWDKSVTEVKEHAFTKLEEELQHAREILRLRDEEVLRLSRIRQDVETELQELTASLFQVSSAPILRSTIDNTYTN